MSCYFTPFSFFSPYFFSYQFILPESSQMELLLVIFRLYFKVLSRPSMIGLIYNEFQIESEYYYYSILFCLVLFLGTSIIQFCFVLFSVSTLHSLVFITISYLCRAYGPTLAQTRFYWTHNCMHGKVIIAFDHIHMQICVTQIIHYYKSNILL